jgi:hypothetical protein
MSSNDRVATPEAFPLVMRGLDPRIHQKSFPGLFDGLPGQARQ